MDKVLYISDLDGTLLNRESQISAKTKNTLNTLIEQGILFTYATARSLHSAYPLTKDINIQLPVIIYNGCSIIDSNTNELLYNCHFSNEQVKELQQVLTKNHPFVYSYIEGKETVLYHQEYINEGMQFYLDKRKGDNRFYPTLEEDIYQGNIFYFTCIGTKQELEETYNQLKDIDQYHVLFHQEIYREEYWLEIMPKQASKAKAILKLKELLKVDKIISFGDGINDKEMFLISDECYAVENAVGSLKQLATGIIDNNQENGVAKWLEHHGK